VNGTRDGAQVLPQGLACAPFRFLGASRDGHIDRHVLHNRRVN